MAKRQTPLGGNANVTTLEVKPNAEQREHGLTARQIQAATLMASGEPVATVADTVGVNRSTLYDWAKLPPFYCYVNYLRRTARQTAENSLFSLVSDAVGVVRECLTSPDDKTRLNAAKYVIDSVSKIQVGGDDPVEEIRQRHNAAAVGWDFGSNEAIDELIRYGLNE